MSGSVPVVAGCVESITKDFGPQQVLLLRLVVEKVDVPKTYS